MREKCKQTLSRCDLSHLPVLVLTTSVRKAWTTLLLGISSFPDKIRQVWTSLDKIIQVHKTVKCYMLQTLIIGE